jgi:hypothetical protein
LDKEPQRLDRLPAEVTMDLPFMPARRRRCITIVVPEEFLPFAPLIFLLVGIVGFIFELCSGFRQY